MRKQEDRVVTDSNQFVVIARGGLKLRGGPSKEFDVVRLVPEDTVVTWEML